MSWDAYRDNLLARGHLDKAAICGNDGAVWTTSPGFTVSTDEAKTIISGFNKSDVLSSGGIKVNGTKYVYITSDDVQIQGKKGTGGVSIAKAKQCVIIGTYGAAGDGKQTAGNARVTVEEMAKYLRDVGF